MGSPTKSEIHCPTPRCAAEVAKYGENYHGVHPAPFYGGQPTFMPDATDRCERCGGYTNGTTWKHVCKQCGKEVEPGALQGLFVPHLCRECDEKDVAEQKARGQVCSRCRQVHSHCCC